MTQTIDLDVLKLEGLNATVNGVVITDVRGTVLWANPAFESLTGYPVEEVIGRSTQILKSGETPDHVYQSLWFTIASGKVWRGRLVNRRRDGSTYHEEMTITPILSPGRCSPRYFVAIKQDISDRARIEAERERLAEDLQEAFKGALLVLANMADLQMPELGKHGRRVADLALGIARILGDYEPEASVNKKSSRDPKLTLDTLWGAALLHDIGKALKSRSGPQGADVRTRRYVHAHIGGTLLGAIPKSESIQEQIRHHHERWDGSGYPDGMKGSEIPLGSRIIAVASAYDHLLHRRHLKTAGALDQLSEESGFRFDPRVIEALSRSLVAPKVQRDLDTKVLISVRDLRPGMVLAEDYRSSSGRLLCRVHTVLDRGVIDRLRSFNNGNSSFDAIRVRRPDSLVGHC